MFCPQCGKPVPDGAQFCNSCGTVVESPNHGAGQAEADSARGKGSAHAAGARPGLLTKVKNALRSPRSGRRSSSRRSQSR